MRQRYEGDLGNNGATARCGSEMNGTGGITVRHGDMKGTGGITVRQWTGE